MAALPVAKTYSSECLRSFKSNTLVHIGILKIVSCFSTSGKALDACVKTNIALHSQILRKKKDGPKYMLCPWRTKFNDLCTTSQMALNILEFIDPTKYLKVYLIK